MADFGARGVQLLKEIMHHDRFTVSAYNEDLVGTIIAEIKEHESLASQMAEVWGRSSSQTPMGTSGRTPDLQTEDMENLDVATAMAIHVQSANRNKKLAMAYMMQRIERLKAVRWSSRVLPATVSANCSPQELEFYKSYDQLLTSYMSKDTGVGEDLTMDERPPKNNLVVVKVLESQGEMMFSFGQADLSRGTLHHLPAEEAEPLIREGTVEVVQAVLH